ncbi:hypothetical protein RUM44_003688 [Polyplax serrata]|uniref:Uncharacterized protein n=1 Tax=Polyplax serrata TaxID=468196 RepID=A0ABR1AH56_POLSC
MKRTSTSWGKAQLDMSHEGNKNEERTNSEKAANGTDELDETKSIFHRVGVQFPLLLLLPQYRLLENAH